jgi:hypothetical protein
MNEIKNQLIQTGFTLDRLHQDGKIDAEAYRILKDRNKQAINYSQCCTQLKGKETPTFEDWLKMNNYELYKNAEYKDENDCSWFTNELLKMYERELTL